MYEGLIYNIGSKMVGYLGGNNLLDMVKYWFWYDWIMLGVRILVSVSIVVITLDFQNSLTLPLWIIIFGRLLPSLFHG